MDLIIDNIQSGCGYNRDITSIQLIIAARTKYNNMIEDKTWSKVDPCDAKIMALTMKLGEIGEISRRRHQTWYSGSWNKSQ